MSSAELLPHELMQLAADFFASDKHLRDIAGIMKLQGPSLDRNYIAAWTDNLGVAAEWNWVQRRVNQRETDQG